MKYTLIILSLALVFASCKKKTSNECTYKAGTTVAPANEELVVTNYLAANNITTAVELEGSGLYYVIDSVGTGTKPTNLCGVVNVTYKGYLPSGTIFDQTTGTSTASFELGGVIEGWTRGLQVAGTGTKMRLFIPASMGYGANGIFNSNTGVYTIPPNSMLIFEVKLLAVTN